ncbi:hypothetical protein KDA14_05535, partial [Candidatus Saccharibacteria bacterium]|nr:hypothetical protein [Candidatus Saccharibacteria bacterium]
MNTSSVVAAVASTTAATRMSDTCIVVSDEWLNSKMYDSDKKNWHSTLPVETYNNVVRACDAFSPRCGEWYTFGGDRGQVHCLYQHAQEADLENDNDIPFMELRYDKRIITAMQILGDTDGATLSTTAADNTREAATTRTSGMDGKTATTSTTIADDIAGEERIAIGAEDLSTSAIYDPTRARFTKDWTEIENSKLQMACRHV